MYYEDIDLEVPDDINVGCPTGMQGCSIEEAQQMVYQKERGVKVIEEMISALNLLRPRVQEGDKIWMCMDMGFGSMRCCWGIERDKVIVDYQKIGFAEML